ncbi:MAG: putative bifunctional diguanylate cyclase/phosphodiesterase, partial [Acidimicrobiales bacterium]
MSSSPLSETLSCSPLRADQARLLVAASPSPLMIVQVAGEGFTVAAASPTLRRLVVGARHPAGPEPNEVIATSGFGALAEVIDAANTFPFEQQTAEIPIGDEPNWYEIVVTPLGTGGTPNQMLVAAADRTADHDIEQRHRRSAKRFEAMVANAPGLILLVDSAGRIIRCSPGVDRLLGVDSEELAGRAIFEMLHPDTLARSASVFNHILGCPGEPIVVSDFGMNHTNGSTIWCEATATNLLHDNDIAAVVVNAHDVTERRLAEQRLELAASSDSLTGLANRRRLETRLTEMFEVATRVDSRVGLVLVDLDDFKLVNDGMGHDVGDAALVALASRLEALVGPNGLIARIGGDEFALAVDPRSGADTIAVAQGVHDALQSPVSVGNREVYLRASVGTTTGHHSGADAGSLLRSADLALYRAKQKGGNQTVRFTAELQLDAEQRLEMVTDLQRALREGRLRLAYQPIVDANNNLIGAEALLRWEHDGELLRPADFLDLAEDTGLILPIGAWVVDQVCADFKAAAGVLEGLEWISVNLSSRQLVDERLAATVRSALETHGVEPKRLGVEVDEATVSRDIEAASIVLNGLGIGVYLTMSDLSRNQDALRLSRRVNSVGIKLDQHLVGQLDTDDDGRYRAIAAAVIDHSHDAALSVVATGVENDAQARTLRDLGCDLFQG